MNTERDALTILLTVIMMATITASATIQITDGPKNASATVGGQVTFQCIYQGTTDLPLWRINGIDYAATDLPYSHLYIPHEGLRVERVNEEMNNTVYICFFITYDPANGQFLTVQSGPAFLMVYSETPEVGIISELQPSVSKSAVVRIPQGTTETSGTGHQLTVTATFPKQLLVTTSPSISEIQPATATRAATFHNQLLVTTSPNDEQRSYSIRVKKGSTSRKHSPSSVVPAALPTQRSFPSATKSSKVILHTGIGCGVTIVVSILGLAVGLGILIQRRCPKKRGQTDAVKEPVYDIVAEPSRSVDATGTSPLYDVVQDPSGHRNEQVGEEIAMQHNSSYVIPPPRLKIKVLKNEAYSGVTLQHQ